MPGTLTARLVAWTAVTLTAISISNRQNGRAWWDLSNCSNDVDSWNSGPIGSYLKNARSSIRHSERLPDQFKPLYATGEKSTAEAASAGPVAMDGSTALPMLVDLPAYQPLSISTWVLVYIPFSFDADPGKEPSSTAINSSSLEGSKTPPADGPRRHPEMTILSFGRPGLDVAATNTTRHPASPPQSPSMRAAPALHLGVGKDPAYHRNLFFSGAADAKGGLVGFFSRGPLPVNRWVHVGLVLTPVASKKGGMPEMRDGHDMGQPKGLHLELSGYVDGELQGRLELETDVGDGAMEDLVSASAIGGTESVDGEGVGGERTQASGSSSRGEGNEQARRTARRRERDRAVFVWGGVRSRGGGMLTGMLQHARLFLNKALSLREMHEVMSELSPWPVPSEVAGPLGLVPGLLPEDEKEELGTGWVETAVRLLHADEEGAGDERKRLAHWYLSGTVLLHTKMRGQKISDGPATDGPGARRKRKDQGSGKGGMSVDGEELPHTNGECSDTGPTTPSTSSATPRDGSNDGEDCDEGSRGAEKGRLAGLTPGEAGTASETPGVEETNLLRQCRRLWRRGDNLLRQAWTSTTAALKCFTAGDEFVRFKKAVESGQTGRKKEERFVLPGASSAHLAQLILMSQALHGLDREETGQGTKNTGLQGTVLDTRFLQKYGEEVLRDLGNPDPQPGRLPRFCSSAISPSPSTSASYTPAGCTVAVAHALSLAETATTRFGFEHGHEAGRERECHTRRFPRSMIIKNIDDPLLRTAHEEEYDGSDRLPLPLYRRSSAAHSTRLARGDQVAYMRMRAKDGEDAEALAWYAQALYWGRHGVHPDRVAAERMMERAAELGNAEAQYNAGIMLLRGEDRPGEGAAEQRAARGEELVDRAARQGFFPALAAQGLWALQRREEGKLEGESEANAEGRSQKMRGNETEAAVELEWEQAVNILERAAMEGHNAEAHFALALVKGGGRVGIRSWQITSQMEQLGVRNKSTRKEIKTDDVIEEPLKRGEGRVKELEEEGAETTRQDDAEKERNVHEALWAVAGHMAQASVGGHAGARLFLANALWDPVLAFDVTSPSESCQTVRHLEHTGRAASTEADSERIPPSQDPFPRPHSLTVSAASLTQDRVLLGSLQRSCPVALHLARSLAEMTIAGLLDEARGRHDVGDLATAHRLYGLAAEAGVVSSLVNAVWLEEMRSGSAKDQKAAKGKKWRRWQELLAFKGWSPALRGLGHEAAAASSSAAGAPSAAKKSGRLKEIDSTAAPLELNSNFMEAVALFHLAGTLWNDSRAFYDLGALLESKWLSLLSMIPVNPSFSTRTFSLLALDSYRKSFDIAKGVYCLPPCLAFLHFWLRSVVAPTFLNHAKSLWHVPWIVEEILLWIALVILGKVVALLLALRRQRRRQDAIRANRMTAENILRGENGIDTGRRTAEKHDLDAGIEVSQRERANECASSDVSTTRDEGRCQPMTLGRELLAQNEWEKRKSEDGKQTVIIEEEHNLDDFQVKYEKQTPPRDRREKILENMADATTS